MRENNFDFLRIVFATFVLFTHSYPLTGHYEGDWLSQLTDKELSFSYIGVKGFFIISGYLIFKSFERSNTFNHFFWKRLLRLFPALIVVLLLTVLGGYFIYKGEGSYWMNSSVWTYIPNNLSLFNLQYSIDGIFETNPYGSAINGSLWTIPYEFVMYLMVGSLFLIKTRRGMLIIILAIFYVSMSLLFLLIGEELFKFDGALNAKYFADLAAFFIAGSILAFFRIEEFKRLDLIALTSFMIIVLSVVFGAFSFTKFLLLPICVISFGILSTNYIKNTSKYFGDPSYGIYIYGFPIQQSLRYLFELEPLELFLFSLPLTFIAGVLSWHFIEKRALKFKTANIFSNEER